MKTINIIWLFVLILLIVIMMFFFFGETAGKQTPANLGALLSCQTDKIDQSVFDLNVDTKTIKAFVEFNQLPLTAEFNNKLAELNVYLDPQTQTFDYMWGTIPTDNLCLLAAEENVKAIFTLKWWIRQKILVDKF